ncbi:MAG: recombination-associated protein RdgC [Thiopseudomonas sp.]|nr:recombination-associated protein RdgC [Thiopseudomonas sp.]
MWFRNLLVYRLNLESPLQPDVLEAALATQPAKACGSQVPSTYGFVAPWGKGADAPLVHASQGFMLIAARQEARILPSSVVRDAVKEKTDEIEAAEARKVYKKEKDQIKDEIIQTLMPRAFIRKSTTFAAIDSQAGLIYVDASSAKRAEELLSAMREAMGSLPVRPVNVKQAPLATFTSWLKNHEASHGLMLLDECELRDSAEDGGIIRIKREDLASEEVQNHLAAGKLATVISLAWEDKLSFLLDDKLAIKRLRFEDLLQSQAEQDGGDDAASQFDASFTLMMLTLQSFIPQLLQALGGEDISQAV